MTAIDPTRLTVLAVVLAAAVALVALTGARRGDHPVVDEPSAVAMPSAAAQPMTDTDAAAVPSTPARQADSRSDEVTPPTAHDVEEAEAVAVAFVEQWASVRHDEPAEATLARVRPYTTQRLAEQLLTDLQHTGRAGPSQLEEVTDAVVEHVHGQTVAGDQITLVIVARQYTRTLEGDALAYPAFTLRLTRVGARWRVHELVA